MEKKKNILIIDDDKFLLDMYTLKFNQSDFSVTTALGPEPALDKLRSGFSPDVILLDIVMPVMDGFELIEKMKEESLARDAIRIILSNRGQPSDIAQGEALGVAGFIIKTSTTPSEVIEKVRNIISNHKK